MPPVQFEEKEIEGPLNVYMASKGLIWSPGQVLEQIVGFDVAMRVDVACFWVSLGYPSIPSGAVISPSWWPQIFRAHFDDDRTPPPFELNAFLQYKRPDYLYGGNAKERQRWGADVTYYRFILDPAQQAALEACASSLGNNGIVVYATPAFWERRALFEYMKLGTLLDNTHFVRALDLAGHSRYTYIDARSKGQAYSRPIEISPYRFGQLRTAAGGGGRDTSSGGGGGRRGPPRDLPPDGGGNGRSPAEILSDARGAAEAAVATSPARVGGQSNFQERQATAIRLAGNVRQDQLAPIRDYVAASVYVSISGLFWYIQ